MMKILIKIVLFFFLIFCSKNSFANNVAIIDLDFLIENSNLGKLTLENISKFDKKNASVLKKKKDNLLKIENEIKNKQNIASQELLNKELNDLKIKINEFNKEKETLVNKFNNFKNDELSNFFNQVTPIIKNYMSENSLDILIDKKKVFMNNSNTDITEIILERVNTIQN